MTYVIALASFTLNARINGSVTATIKGGNPQPEIGLSAEAPHSPLPTEYNRLHKRFRSAM